MKRLLWLACVAAWVLGTSGVPAQPLTADQQLSLAINRISGDRLLQDVARLSSDFYNGRQAGTPDDERAAFYVSEQLETLHPIIRLTRLSMDEAVSTTVTHIAPGTSMTLRPTDRQSDRREVLHVGRDYLPVLDSASAHVEASVVFVGYGIVDRQQGIDEYAGVDVKDRIVLFLRGKPTAYSGSVSQTEKVRIAHEKGAVAYLMATGPILTAYEARRGLGGRPLASYAQSSETLPGAWISTEVAARLWDGSGETLQAKQEQVNRLSPASQPLPMLVDLHWTSTKAEASLRNVGYVLPGSDTALQRETILIGAHRDHFGNQAGMVFSGADDNASGTAVLLEVARALAQAGVSPKRSVALVSFTGEEQGLVGSTAYVRHPPLPLEQTKAMVNIDHAGVGNGRLTVGVTTLDKSLAVEAGRRSGLEDKLDVFGYFPGGDHVPFKEAGVPTATIVSGGIHPHFHQASDKADTISPEVLMRAARYALALVLQLANAP